MNINNVKASVRNGMSVRSLTGQKLGKVIRCEDDFFVVEKGLFFPQDRDLHYFHVSDIRGEEIIYDLEERMPQAAAKPAAVAPAATKPSTEPLAWQKTELSEERDLRVPLMDEEVSVQKTTKDAGEVRIHKGVVVEERNITVPLRREEVIVERVQATGTSVPPTAHVFEEERYAIPVHEEDFELKKQPVVREEVRVRRVTHQEQRAASARLRHEELDVEDMTHEIKVGAEREIKKT